MMPTEVFSSQTIFFGFENCFYGFNPIHPNLCVWKHGGAVKLGVEQLLHIKNFLLFLKEREKDALFSHIEWVTRLKVVT